MQSKRQQTPVIWEDQVTNKFHVVNNTNGEKVPCNQFGLPLLPFRPGISGEATTKPDAETGEGSGSSGDLERSGAFGNAAEAAGDAPPLRARRERRRG